MDVVVLCGHRELRKMTAALPSVLFTFSTHDQNKNKNYKKFSFRFPSFVISCCPGIDRQVGMTFILIYPRDQAFYLCSM